MPRGGKFVYITYLKFCSFKLRIIYDHYTIKHLSNLNNQVCKVFNVSFVWTFFLVLVPTLNGYLGRLLTILRRQDGCHDLNLPAARQVPFSKYYYFSLFKSSLGKIIIFRQTIVKQQNRENIFVLF